MNHTVTAGHHDTLDVSNLSGHWVNVNPKADFIATLELAIDNDDLILTILAAQNPAQDSATIEPQNQITVHPIAGDAGHQAGGFYAYEHPAAPDKSQQLPSLAIAANEKNGILVLQCYRAGIAGHQLTREFYARASTSKPTNQPISQAINEPINQPINQARFNTFHAADNLIAKADFAPLAGNWLNTHANSRWINTIAIQQSADGWTLTASSDSQDHQWPSVPLTPYFFDQQEMGFTAYCVSDQLTTLFTAYSNKGLFVVMAYHCISEAGENGQPTKIKKILNREFYVKQ
ncbi:MAG: hypothetical protein ACI8WB_002066 [Phenylobacterium sp.]|jgi:hypothetical protein